MNSIQQAGDNLRAALRTVKELRVHEDIGAGVTPPAAIVGVPALEWADMLCGSGGGPSSAQFLVYIVVPLDEERAAARLFDLVPKAAAAIDSVRDASVLRATPGTYPTSAGELPAYEITVAVDL